MSQHPAESSDEAPHYCSQWCVPGRLVCSLVSSGERSGPRGMIRQGEQAESSRGIQSHAASQSSPFCSVVSYGSCTFSDLQPSPCSGQGVRVQNSRVLYLTLEEGPESAPQGRARESAEDRRRSSDRVRSYFCACVYMVHRAQRILDSAVPSHRRRCLCVTAVPTSSYWCRLPSETDGARR